MSHIEDFQQFTPIVAPRRVNKLTPRTEGAFWCFADEAATKATQLRSGYNHTDIYEALEERFGFMDNQRIYNIGEKLYNRNRVATTVSRELALASLLFEWRGIDSLANPDKKSFRDWYHGTVTLYSGRAFNPFLDDPFQIEDTPASRPFVSTSLDRSTALLFTQSGRAQKAWLNTKEQDGWILETEVTGSDIYFYNDIMDERECVMKTPLSFTRKTRIIAGQVADPADWGMYHRYKKILGK